MTDPNCPRYTQAADQQRGVSFSTIDLFVHVLGRTFDQAMAAILQR